MKRIRKALDRAGKHFEPGARFEKFYPLYEALDTIMFTPASVTKDGVHVRDGLDSKRMMFTVLQALLPCLLFGMWNTGYQTHVMVEAGGALLDNWQSDLFLWFGLEPDPESIGACMLHGAIYFVPIFLVVQITGGICEPAFAIIRKHEVNEGFLVTGALIPLILPATIPLWMVALGTAFGVIVGKEIFGGTGMNFLNPALTARAFLFFAYPAYMSGNIWIAAEAPDGVSSATWLASYAEGSGHLDGLDWMDAFLGVVPGSIGETSTLAALIGAGVLIFTGIGSWRTMVGVAIGTFVTGYGLNLIGSTTNPMMELPVHYHFVIGSWAFATVFMATDPVSSAFTQTGKLIYGFFIGVLGIIIRSLNPAYPEGMMLAILFMNMFAPLIDHFVIEANKRRRARRYARA
ncbi:MAG: NADH:ubiquinone reductase (Na(+)-transporting) subunit B [Myxococcota bacterium]